jgi:hypothetical protein
MNGLFRPTPRVVDANPEVREFDPTYSLDRLTAEARRDMGEARWAQLNREWHEAECDRREAVWEASKELADRNREGV